MFVCAVIIENHMINFIDRRQTHKKIINKAQKIHSCLGQGVLSKNFACRYLQGCCQIQYPMPRICAFHASDPFAVGVPHVSPGPLNHLNCRFFIHTENNRVLRRIQIQPDNIGCFSLEIRVMAYTPGTLAVKLNIVFSGKAPYSPSGYSTGLPLRWLFSRPSIPYWRNRSLHL